MLTLTENAQNAVRAIVEQAAETEAAGLRIQGTSASPEGYALTIASAPETDDSVVESGPVRVFLPQESATELDDKVLDAEMTPEGVRFALAVQG